MASGSDQGKATTEERGRRRLEEQVRQKQNLEALKSLAGGVAHDFNNILTIITGNLAFVKEAMEPRAPRNDDVIRESLQEIEEAVAKACALAGRLLAFGRRESETPRSLDTAAFLAEQEPLLRRLLVEDCALEVRCDEGVGRI